jgi:ribosomal protein S18 acetylase RimI-like enzyme
VSAFSLERSVAVRRIVSHAFCTDPLLEWIFPDPATRLECTAAWMGLFVEEYLVHARVDTVEHDGEVVAAALWRIPATTPLPHPEVPSIPGLLGALVGADRQAAIGAALRAFSVARPSDGIGYLQFLAVDPPHQGRGIGRRAIEPGLDELARCGLDAYLETTNPRNLSFYFSLGFEVVAEFTLDVDGPAAWCLRRSQTRSQ